MSSEGSPSTGSEVFLGVDGGGTSTGFCLRRADGVELARTEGPGSYYLGCGAEQVRAVLDDGLRGVCAQAGIAPGEIAFAYLGLPGYGDVEADRAMLDALPAHVLGSVRYRCGNDAVCAWAGSLAGADGVNVVSGTGSIAYGERGGAGVRVGGWSQVFGDEGSAHWIGQRGLSLFARMSDGRETVGPLHGLIRAHLGLADDHDLVDLVLNRWAASRVRIAGIAVVVSQAAAAGDAAATGLLQAAAAELAGHVVAVRDRLGWRPGDVVPVSWSGGAFTDPVLREAFRAGLSGPDWDVRPPRYDPATGAALLAVRLHA